MKIAIGADHRGFALKQQIKDALLDVSWIDAGAYSAERSDYPLFADAVVREIKAQHVSLGILLCGTGIGMVIAANRYKGVYAGLAWNQEIARRAKEDDNINVLVLPADYISLEQAVIMIKTWISAEYRGGRYQARIELIDG